ncbi:MAG: VWA domain-containing protein [Bacteroidota bacterium]
MFLEFFYLLRENGIPVTFHEHQTLLEALDKEIAGYKVEEFYYLCRTVLVKQEIHLDRFDVLFGHFFKGAELLDDEFFFSVPEEWLKRQLERQFTEEEKAMIEAMGGLDKLMERMRELLKEQRERHEGGNKWIGTAGTSPFGAYGFNPEGFRIGGEGGNRSAIKIWEKRDFANLDDSVELETRNIKLALRRLRTLTREGNPDELDLDDTIKRTSKNAGWLELSMVPERKNNIKVLLLMDVGGSMDDHVEICSRLFSAAKYEFKHLEFYYFHNCLYESVWKDNKLRHNERIPTLEIINKFNKDYKVVFIGDACMSPYEIMYSGGSIEHYNDEPGLAWLKRITDHFDYTTWINPMPENSWNYFESTLILREFMGYRMFPMTIDGLGKTVKALKSKKVRNMDTPPVLR